MYHFPIEDAYSREELKEEETVNPISGNPSLALGLVNAASRLCAYVAV